MNLHYSGNARPFHPELFFGSVSLMLSYAMMEGEASGPPSCSTDLKRMLNVKNQRTPKKKGKEAKGVGGKAPELKIGRVESHFLDSGAFTLLTSASKYAKKHKCSRWKFYDTKAFWKYVDSYAAFVKEHQIGIDYYAVVDAIPNAEITYRNQKYMEEKHGLSPVPVVHYGCKVSWLEKYLEEGYAYVGLGGLVGAASEAGVVSWLDRCFDVVCDQPSRLPKIKLHGFGVTSHPLLLRYPWWSVDSASWTKVGAFGGILVPYKREGKFTFTKPPLTVSVSGESPKANDSGKHYLTMSRAEQKIMREWLELIDVPMGRLGEGGEIEEFGVTTRHIERRKACLLYFEALRKSLPEWPWPFKSTVTARGLGLFR